MTDTKEIPLINLRFGKIDAYIVLIGGTSFLVSYNLSYFLGLYSEEKIAYLVLSLIFVCQLYTN